MECFWNKLAADSEALLEGKTEIISTERSCLIHFYVVDSWLISIGFWFYIKHCAILLVDIGHCMQMTVRY